MDMVQIAATDDGLTEATVPGAVGTGTNQCASNKDALQGTHQRANNITMIGP